MLFVKNYDIVTPGEMLADEGVGGSGTYTEGKKIFSKYLGTVMINKDWINVSQLNGAYIPKEGDEVIGKIAAVEGTYWAVDIDTSHYCRLDAREANTGYRVEDLSELMDVGDVVYAKIIRVGNDLSSSLGLRGGRYGKLPASMLIKFNPMKISRIIGKEGSMINLLRERSKCDILLGKNGVAWVSGDKIGMEAVLAAINVINEDSYTGDMSAKVRDILERYSSQKSGVE
ncbi:MAG: KH domain-containing protein [Candidatus Acidifodinimicrobium sp.]